MKKPSGQLLIIILIFITTTTIIAIALLGLLNATSRSTGIYALDQQAQHIAEAGVDRAIWCLNHPSVCGSGYTGETTTLNVGQFVSTVTTLSSSVRQIEVTAYVPNQASARRTKTIRTEVGIDATSISFNYGVQVGEGGLTLENNAVITGNIYSNGSITGANGANVTGDVFVATGMQEDTTWTVNNADQVFAERIGGSCTTSPTDIAQSFKPNTTGPLSMISVYIKKSGNPSDISMHIVSDSSGSPSKTSLASGTLNASLVTGSYGWINITFPTPVTVTANQTYWMLFDASCDNAKFWTWGKDQNQGFGNGLGKTSPDWQAATPSWSIITGDLNFKVYVGGLATSISQVSVGGDVHANTIQSSTITGDAYYQTILSSTVTGTSNPGSADPAVQTLPVSDANITEWEQEAESGGVTVGDTTISTNMSLGPKKIVGNLTLINNAIVTLTGPVWVVGDITFDNGSIIELDPNYGSGSTVIIADDPANRSTKGKIIIQNGANFFGSGSSTSYVMILSTHSGAATYAIDIKNGTEGAIFYTSLGTINIENGVALKEVTGYKIHLAPTATITYESGLANAQFTSGPGASWALLPKSWREL